MILLLITGICDLWKKEIPGVLLYGIAIVALLVFLYASLWERIFSVMVSVSLGAISCLLVHSRKIGGGDVWILICFAWIWPLDVFWRSLSYAVMLLGIVAGGIWLTTGDENWQVPMVPFLILGYWM